MNQALPLTYAACDASLSAFNNPLSTTGHSTPLLDPQVVLAADRLACMMQRTSRSAVYQHAVVVEPESAKGEKVEEKKS
jgi:hypothetical protein